MTSRGDAMRPEGECSETSEARPRDGYARVTIEVPLNTTVELTFTARQPLPPNPTEPQEREA